MDCERNSNYIGYSEEFVESQGLVLTQKDEFPGA